VSADNRRQQCRLAIVGSSADNSLIYHQYDQHRRLLAADPFSNAHGLRYSFRTPEKTAPYVDDPDSPAFMTPHHGLFVKMRRMPKILISFP
jgi:hypothetical protein